MLSCAVARALALSLLDKRPALGSDGDTPSSSDVLLYAAYRSALRCEPGLGSLVCCLCLCAGSAQLGLQPSVTNSNHHRGEICSTFLFSFLTSQQAQWNLRALQVSGFISYPALLAMFASCVQRLSGLLFDCLVSGLPLMHMSHFSDSVTSSCLRVKLHSVSSSLTFCTFSFLCRCSKWCILQPDSSGVSMVSPVRQLFLSGFTTRSAQFSHFSASLAVTSDFAVTSGVKNHIKTIIRKKVSSKSTFIKGQFHQRPLSSETLSSKPLSSETTFITNPTERGQDKTRLGAKNKTVRISVVMST